MDQPDALDFAREAAWEVSAVDRAVKRYRKFAEGREPAELPPGQRVLAETVGPVSAAIRAAQDEAAAHGRGAPPPWHAPILAFDPDVLAVSAVATALRAPLEADRRVGMTIPRYSRAVCTVLRDQAEYDAWAAAQKQAARDGDERAGWLLRQWHRQHPDGSRRAWRAFRARVEAARQQVWPDATQIAVGAMLARTLADAAPRWFEIAQAGEGPKHMQPLCLLLTQRAVDQMADAEARAEVARPLLLPMLIPPLPWRYADDAQAPSGTLSSSPARTAG